MQMNDIIEGLNSCDYPQGPPPCNVGGCGFGSWIWILLILFYSNQGRGNACCRDNKAAANCCGTGLGGVGGGYLFLLVILFLCGGYGDCGHGFDGSFAGIC